MFQPFANSNNPFVDFFIGVFCRDVILLDVITSLAWVGEKSQYLLVRVVPKTEESFDDVKSVLIDELEDAGDSAPFKYKCFGQVILDQIGRKNLLLKLWKSDN